MLSFLCGQVKMLPLAMGRSLAVAVLYRHLAFIMQLSVASAGCLLPILLVAAYAGQDSPVIKAGVREVLVPTIVTDRSGKYVTDLDGADFTIFEDGAEQKIVGFSRPPVPDSTHDPRTGGSHSQPNVSLTNNPTRTYLICLDTLHSSFDHFARARKALGEFFSKQEPGQSQYALMALGLNLHVVVDSTRDPGVIFSALGSKNLLKAILDSGAVDVARQADEFSRTVGLWCSACDCTSSTVDMKNPECPTFNARVRAMLFSFSERTAFVDRNFLRQLLSIVHAISSMPTQRTVIFLSDGFSRFPGEELYSILRAYRVNDPSLKFNGRDTQSDLDQVLQVAVRYNVRFYTIDSRGLYTYAAASGSGQDASSGGVPSAVTQMAMSVAWQNSGAMVELAHETGGAFFENSNDLLKGIRRAFDDGREQYVLAYVPSNSQMNGKFRQIRVEVKRKNLIATAKTGYWATK
jgi:VWFA-related protein